MSIAWRVVLGPVRCLYNSKGRVDIISGGERKRGLELIIGSRGGTPHAHSDWWDWWSLAGGMKQLITCSGTI